ncbi:MAG: hypothetical protein LIP06_14045 [Tannerellaceae bacterium]|nr:hypothetical protein [Tannerellaceae bacterium]
MSTTFNKILSYLIVCLTLFYGISEIKAESLASTKRKEINKFFPVNSNDLLKVENRFGNITISHWNKQEVGIQVIIETQAANDQRAQQELDQIEIQTYKSGNIISAITQLKNSRSNHNSKITIDYFITLPASVSIDLDQQYGNINLPQKNEGKALLKVQYGNIKAGSFSKPLTVKAQYSNVDLENVNRLDMKVNYCGDVSIGNGEVMDIKSNYSNITLQQVRHIDIDKKYGKLKIKSAEQVSIEVKYSDVQIDYLARELQAKDISYGPLHIQELAPDFKTVRINAYYSTSNISISSHASFTVEGINLRYGSFNMNGFRTTHESSEEKGKFYKYIANGGKGGTIYFNGNSYSHIHINPR